MYMTYGVGLKCFDAPPGEPNDAILVLDHLSFFQEPERP
jgi:hypothetical protein